MNRQRQKLATQIAALVLAGLALAALIFRLAVYEPRAAPGSGSSSRPGPADAPVRAVVVSVEGEVQRGSANGTWSAVAPGQTVRPDELLRTGANSHTDVTIGQRSHLTIGASSELRIQELTGMVHRFRLTRGQMTAEYEAEGGRVLRVEDGTGQAIAEARSARFSVLSTGTAIAVATRQGEVELRSQRQSVRIGAGQQAIAFSGAAPSQPTAIRTGVLLRVANAAGASTHEACAEVDGEAAPGSDVTVDGEPVPVAADGHFHRRVARARRKDAVLVAIRDAAGHEQSRTVPCTRPPATIEDMAIRWRKP